MGYPGKASECEYATQIAVWQAADAIYPGQLHISNPTVQKIYNDVWAKAKKLSDSGATKLTLKVNKADKTAGTATVTPEVTENSSKVAKNGTITLNNVTATQDGKTLTSGGKVASNKAIELKKSGNGDGSISVKFNGYNLSAPVYNASDRNSQDTVALVGTLSKPLTATYKIGEEEKPPTDDKQKKKSKRCLILRRMMMRAIK